MLSHVDIVDRYLTKIQFSQPLRADLDTLDQLLTLHEQHIAFGNLAQYLGQPVAIDLQQVANKLLIQAREGYCLEHNVLTKHILTALGYEVFHLLGRVYYQNMHVTTPPRTHLISIVQLNGRAYLFDPGFGSMTPTAVLALDKINQTQTTALESFRFIAVEDTGLPLSALVGMKYMLQAFVRSTWINVYAFNPEHAVSDSDLMLAHWYVSTSPQSIFTQQLMFSIIDQQQRKTINHNVFKIYSAGNVIKQQLENIDQYNTCLQQHFKLKLSDSDLAALSQKVYGG